MMTSPLVSVVMSVYNAEKYLPEAIDSILNQSFKDFEFIIIEDCSTDNSLTILKSYADKDSRIRIIQKQENKRMKGFIENLNIGLNEAKGKYIARMDSDDIALPHRFKKQVMFLEQNPDIFMVGSSVNFIDENNKIIGEKKALENDAEIKNRMFNHISMYHPVLMFRNDGTAVYREKMFYCEDYDLYLRLMNLGKKFYNFLEPLLNYRVLDSSLSRKDNRFNRILYVEKMRQFYLETKNKGRDSYQEFVAEDFLKILSPNVLISKENLKFALGITTKYHYKKEFKILLEKYHKNYTSDYDIFTLKVLNKMPSFLSKIYFKLIKPYF